ncbi:MAG: hypothetical protein ABII81_06350 [Pseudomonadota bacterium]
MLHHTGNNTARAQLQRLRVPFLIALTLHAMALFSLNVDHDRAQEINLPAPLMIRLMPAQLPQAGQKKHSSALAKMMDAEPVLSSSTSEMQLDMSLIRDQARAYASALPASNGPGLSVEGDYYGSYGGDDSGVFFFHMNRDGQGTGTGESESFGIPFVISGKVDAQGKLHMTGNGVAGEARFNGQLDMRSGEVKGTWTVHGLLKGSFAGHREAQRVSFNN